VSQWKPFAALRLIRIGNCLVAGATSLAGSWVSGSALHRDKPWLLAISAMLIAAFGNAYNDICDLPADRVNRPERVLVRGDIDMVLALRIAGWCLALGLMTAAYAYVNALILAVTVSTVLFVYDRDLKSQPLVGNAAVAAICGATVAYGAIAGPGWNRQVLVLMVSAFSLTLVRELYKDIQDIEGDVAMGARTFPILFGERRSALVSLLPLAFTVTWVLYRIFSSVPDWTGAYVVGVALVAGLLWTAFRSVSSKGPAQWGRRAREVKIWIVLGVVWVLVWRFRQG
jgi:geranylgeranylglycerol-phosphate geranylgeranyltransferase